MSKILCFCTNLVYLFVVVGDKNRYCESQNFKVWQIHPHTNFFLKNHPGQNYTNPTLFFFKFYNFYPSFLTFKIYQSHSVAVLVRLQNGPGLRFGLCRTREPYFRTTERLLSYDTIEMLCWLYVYVRGCFNPHLEIGFPCM